MDEEKMFGLTLINVRKGLLGKVSRSTYIMELFVEEHLLEGNWPM